MTYPISPRKIGYEVGYQLGRPTRESLDGQKTITTGYFHEAQIVARSLIEDTTLDQIQAGEFLVVTIKRKEVPSQSVPDYSPGEMT